MDLRALPDFDGGWSGSQTRAAVEAIGPRLADLLHRSANHGLLPGVAADDLARTKIGRQASAHSESVSA